MNIIFFSHKNIKQLYPCHRLNIRFSIDRLLFISCFSLLIFFSQNSIAQTATVFGRVTNEKKIPVELATVTNSASNEGVFTDVKGKYSLKVPAGAKVDIRFSSLGYVTVTKSVQLKEGEKYELNISFQQKYDSLPETVIQDKEIRDQPIIKINPKDFEALPSTTGGIEAILKVLGASSNNELSSQYSVRGGNYDENLVYVNDFEVYRPFLVRSGQQEGLSFVNPDLVGSILFSQGGFQAKYGDKMSSVLDIQYRKPKKFEGIVGMSLLGGNVSLSGETKNHRFGYLIGFRQKSNQYLLNSMETKGDYRPSFTDVQSMFTYELSEKWHLEALGNFSRNKFRFIPEDRVTTFGLVNRAIQLDMYFNGAEIDKFISGMGGLSATYRPNKKLMLKFLASCYGTQEDETYDITGEYFLGEVQTDLGKSNFGQVLYGIGVGAIQDWGRNYLNATVVTGGHRGSYIGKRQFIQWGIQYQRELINDKLNQWGIVDSAGYNIPYSDSLVLSNYVYKTRSSLNSNRYSGFVQDSWNFTRERLFTLTLGTRFSYWDVNQQFLVSPRAQLSYTPKWDSTDIVFRAAVGAYDQPPFYRELRDLEGNINLNVKAQRSVHFVLGADYNFVMWDRPFKFITEAYYKLLRDLNTYELDNVRIRYFGNNSAKGFATGIDFRLHGEFTKDAESWISLSILNTKEDITNDVAYNYTYSYDTTLFGQVIPHKIDSAKFYPGYIPRPTDQRVNVGMFFQDYLPGHENFKVYLNLLFGTGFPTGPPDHQRFRDTLRLPPYRRLDIGFSALLLDGSKEENNNKVWGHFTSIWASLEVFNLLQIPNTISYLWVKDNYGTVYSVPNYLTSRRINVRLVAKF